MKNGDLTREQRAALQKAFEHDVFIKGMLELRQVATHVVRHVDGGGPTIYATGNAPIRLTEESSAMAVFHGPVVMLPDVVGEFHRVDHLRRLQEAERRIGAALAKAGHRGE